jgi:predicted dinucleotide-binding enzyme
MSKARIGILGTGDVGQSLGRGFCAEGHEVRMGSRDPGSEKVRQWVAANGPRASAGTFARQAASPSRSWRTRSISSALTVCGMFG